MSLYCESDYSDGDDFGWWWEAHPSFDVKPPATKRSRKCCSCGGKIHPGEMACKIPRWRNPKNFIEEKIHGDEVQLTTWHFCETCADLAASISELGLCFDINEPLKDQISEFNAGLGR